MSSIKLDLYRRDFTINTLAIRLNPAYFAEVEAALERLAAGPEPMVTLLPRRTGHKEARWAHLLGGPPAEEPAAPSAPREPREEAAAGRLAALEERVARLEAELERLRREVGSR